MDIFKLLEQANFETEVRQSWIAVFDRRPEFRSSFGTSRIGKVQDDRFYITPSALSTAAEILIKDAGLELRHLPSRDSTRAATYPGFELAGRTEQEMEAFVAILRNVINSHINKPAESPFC
jgi:hypothetical protein